MDEFIFKKGSSLKVSEFIKTNKLTFGDYQKGSSWSEKGVKLFPKRTINLLKVLICCNEPATTNELMEILGFASRDKLRELSLVPLRKDNLLNIPLRIILMRLGKNMF